MYFDKKCMCAYTYTLSIYIVGASCVSLMWFIVLMTMKLFKIIFHQSPQWEEEERRWDRKERDSNLITTFKSEWIPLRSFFMSFSQFGLASLMNNNAFIFALYFISSSFFLPFQVLAVVGCCKCKNVSNEFLWETTHRSAHPALNYCNL